MRRSTQPAVRGGKGIMDSRETRAFAERLQREVWERFDAEAVPRFYHRDVIGHHRKQRLTHDDVVHRLVTDRPDRKSTRLNSSHVAISYAVFCLKKKTN